MRNGASQRKAQDRSAGPSHRPGAPLGSQASRSWPAQRQEGDHRESVSRTGAHRRGRRSLLEHSRAKTQREAVDTLIARVIHQALREADAVNAVSEARGIFHVAQSFADELAAADPGFDRARFIKDAALD